MKELKAMSAVYCYMFPETWESLEKVQEKISRNLFLRTTKAQDITDLFEDVFDPPLEFPAKKSGSLKDCLNLDELFIPVSKRIVERYKNTVLGLENFENIYPSPGSSDVIFKTLAYLKSSGVEKINVFKSEYEGFGISAKAQGLDVSEYDLKKISPEKKEEGVWYVSNPSSIDGNILCEDFLKKFLDAGNKVVFDLAYVGSTGKSTFDVSHKNVMGVLMSPSKPYGVFEERVTGFAFLSQKYFPREKANDFLYGNRWFTDKVRTLQSLKLVEDLGPRADGSFHLVEKYKGFQKEIVSSLVEQYGLPFRASDSFLLANIRTEDLVGISDEKLGLIKDFKRGDNYRFCLTPYFELLEAST